MNMKMMKMKWDEGKVIQIATGKIEKWVGAENLASKEHSWLIRRIFRDRKPNYH